MKNDEKTRPRGTIEDFFYTKASTRIKRRIDETKLKQGEIYKPHPKQISRIINNKNTIKNNPFLIPDAVINNCYIDEKTGNYIDCGLLNTPELKFKNIQEILWGTNEEISTYLSDLFFLLWTEVTTPSTSCMIDAELYLCDYVPYAKNSTYWNILFSPTNKYPAILYGIREDTIIKELDASRNEAFTFLYSNCKSDFLTFFQSFTEEHVSFHKLDKTIKESLIPGFINVLNSHKPNSSSLGLRVRDLITADLSHSASIITTENFNTYRSSLNKASSNYILSLEQIQKKYVIKKRNGAD